LGKGGEEKGQKEGVHHGFKRGEKAGSCLFWEEMGPRRKQPNRLPEDGIKKNLSGIAKKIVGEGEARGTLKISRRALTKGKETKGA